MMLALKIIMIIAIVFVCLFLLTLIIYFFNLDMKLAASLIKPLTAWYDWSKRKREAKKEKLAQKEQQKAEKEASK
ncbi:MAG: hypothetical protein MJ162_00420 [Treponema sp.]|nr:hypothetical protein [Treponema sp.]